MEIYILRMLFYELVHTDHRHHCIVMMIIVIIIIIVISNTIN